MTQSVVLLSAGLDSSFNLFKASQETKVILALTFDYGQRAATKEVACAAKLCGSLSIPHKVIDLPWFRDFTKTALVSDAKLPVGQDVAIDHGGISQKTMKAVWVPNRNGIFLNIAAGFAEGLGADVIIPGFNLEEAQTFPDNSQGYLDALTVSFEFSTNRKVRTYCYSTAMTKTEIIRAGLPLGLPLGDLWPCYQASDTWCGVCESCQRFLRAVRESNSEDLVKGCVAQ